MSMMLFRPILSERLPRGIEARRVERLIAEPRIPIMVNEAPKDVAYPGNVGIVALQLASANEIAKQSGTIPLNPLERELMGILIETSYICSNILKIRFNFDQKIGHPRIIVSSCPR
jgi:hypothetical protein